MAEQLPPYAPVLLGLLAGGTVILGALPIIGARISRERMASLALVASGILAYIALETGSEASEILEHMLEKKLWGEFLVGALTTSLALVGTWILLSSIERERGVASVSQNTPLVIATALGVHNVAEGFAIAAALLAGAVASAITFTLGFAIHNFTEGFAIAAPGALVRSRWLSVKRVAGLALLAGLPVSLGASVYYTGFNNEIFFANLNTIATAALVYPMVRINLMGASMLGGFNARFWTWFFAGVATAYGLESVIIASLG